MPASALNFGSFGSNNTTEALIHNIASKQIRNKLLLFGWLLKKHKTAQKLWYVFGVSGHQLTLQVQRLYNSVDNMYVSHDRNTKAEPGCYQSSLFIFIEKISLVAELVQISVQMSSMYSSRHTTITEGVNSFKKFLGRL